MTVVEGRVVHNAMSQLPDSLGVYSSLIRIVAQVHILPVAVALPSLQRRLKVSLAVLVVSGNSIHLAFLRGAVIEVEKPTQTLSASHDATAR